MNQCRAIGCPAVVPHGVDFCSSCAHGDGNEESFHHHTEPDSSCCETQSPTGLADLDVYAIHHQFDIHDPSGCIQSASMKLLMSGAKDDLQRRRDVEQARNLLNRWLELNTL